MSPLYPFFTIISLNFTYVSSKLNGTTSSLPVISKVDTEGRLFKRLLRKAEL